MIDTDNTHANDTNPCQGICAIDKDGFCVGCFRTQDERSRWYDENNEWRESVLVAIKKREEDAFGQ